MNGGIIHSVTRLHLVGCFYWIFSVVYMQFKTCDWYKVDKLKLTSLLLHQPLPQSAFFLCGDDVHCWDAFGWNVLLQTYRALSSRCATYIICYYKHTEPCLPDVLHTSSVATHITPFHKRSFGRITLVGYIPLKYRTYTSYTRPHICKGRSNYFIHIYELHQEIQVNTESPCTSDVHLTVRRDKSLIIKPTRCTNFSNLFSEWNSICFGQFLCPSSGVQHCTHSNGICQTGLLTACEQDQDGTAVPSWSCMT
jgi:hypothetical protein